MLMLSPSPAPTRASSAASVRRVAVPLIALLVLGVLAIFAPWLSLVSPSAIPSDGVISSLQPSMAHPFGTDPLGRDVLSRIIYGTRVSLGVAMLSVLLATSVGVAYGACAGWLGGVADSAGMRVLDVAMSVPRLLVLLCVAALWDGLGITGLVLLLGLTGWYDIARLVRGEVRTLRTRDFVSAARASGVREVRILLRHVLPHVWPTIAVTATLGIANTIALEAGLSFLGLGVQPPDASWGTMLADNRGALGASRWWLTVFPGLAVVTTVLACNALGDALRDALVPGQVAA